MADVWGDRHNIDPDDPVLNDRGWVAARLSNLYAEIDHLRAEARRARELEARVAETRAAIKNAMSAWYVEEARSALQADLDRYPEEES